MVYFNSSNNQPIRNLRRFFIFSHSIPENTESSEGICLAVRQVCQQSSSTRKLILSRFKKKLLVLYKYETARGTEETQLTPTSILTTLWQLRFWAQHQPFVVRQIWTPHIGSKDHFTIGSDRFYRNRTLNLNFFSNTSFTNNDVAFRGMQNNASQFSVDLNR